VAELACGNCPEKESLRLARGVLEIRRQAIARVACPFQEVIALGQPQIDEFAVVALRCGPEPLECRAGLCVTFAAEQPLRTPELESVAARPGGDRLHVRQRLELGTCQRGQIA